jgi:spoIIIJ-associated protein
VSGAGSAEPPESEVSGVRDAGAGNDLTVEASGETVGEAKWVALRELEKLAPGLDKGAVRFQVLSEGERGLLGVGFTPARVLATVEAGPGADGVPEGDESEVAARVRAVVERITGGLGIGCRVRIDEDPDTVTATCTGGELGIMIGRHGQTIDAIQYLVNAIVRRRFHDAAKQVVVDASGYRERRRAVLDDLATRSAERAARSSERVELEPMTAVERKIVHERLKDYPGVQTASEGTEPNRFVVVLPSE